MHAYICTQTRTENSEAFLVPTKDVAGGSVPLFFAGTHSCWQHQYLLFFLWDIRSICCRSGFIADKNILQTLFMFYLYQSIHQQSFVQLDKLFKGGSRAERSPEATLSILDQYVKGWLLVMPAPPGLPSLPIWNSEFVRTEWAFFAGRLRSMFPAVATNDELVLWTHFPAMAKFRVSLTALRGGRCSLKIVFRAPESRQQPAFASSREGTQTNGPKLFWMYRIAQVTAHGGVTAHRVRWLGGVRSRFDFRCAVTSTYRNLLCFTTGGGIFFSC